jgi:ABC-type phosphate transport system substrate-binding protein
MKAGRGIPVQAMGLGNQLAFGRDLATEFVKAEKTIQWRFNAVVSEPAAVAGFLTGQSRELLFLSERPNEQTMRQHGTKWNELQPTESTPAASAVAVVVHPTNKLVSLSLDQLQSILNGKTADWKLLGSGSGEIRPFSLPADTTTGRIIAKELMPFTQATKLKPRKDMAEVLSAVSLDPLAIGFVDLAAIPPGQNVRILPIGTALRAADPTPANIKSGMYPLAQRMFLYVHPKASDTAKEFAKFLTSGECDDTFRKHGLIPLSDRAVAGLDKLPAQPAPPIGTSK